MGIFTKFIYWMDEYIGNGFYTRICSFGICFLIKKNYLVFSDFGNFVI